jgi:hypothetical protein
MGNPVITRTVTVPADATGVRVDIPGKYVKLVSCTAASVLLGFDGSTPERVFANDSYAGPPDGFAGLRFIDDIGAGSIVVIQISTEPILGGMLIGLAPLAASLASIDGKSDHLALIRADTTRVIPATQRLLVPRTVIPQVGAVPPSIEILPANAGRKWFMLQACLGNAGNIYLGFDNLVDADDSFFEGWAGSTCRETYTGAIWACSQNGTEEIKGYEVF